MKFFLTLPQKITGFQNVSFSPLSTLGNLCVLLKKKKLELTRGSHDFDIASYQKGDSKYVKRNFIRKKKKKDNDLAS